MTIPTDTTTTHDAQWGISPQPESWGPLGFPREREPQDAFDEALRTAFRAPSRALPLEDPRLLDARYALWERQYRPRTPAAYHLLNECVRASLHADRAEDALNAFLDEQAIAATSDWRRERERELKSLTQQWPVDPALLLQDLHAFSLGCDWLIGRWERLGTLLETNGGWAPIEREEVFLLVGCFPETTERRWDALEFMKHIGLIYDSSDLLKGVDFVDMVLKSMRPKPPKVSLRGAQGAPWLADPGVTLARMKQEVVDRLAWLRVESARLWMEVDEPSRLRAVQRAKQIKDEVLSKRFARDRAEAKTAFVQLEKELERMLEKDAARARVESQAANDQRRAWLAAGPDFATSIPAPAPAAAVVEERTHPVVFSVVRDDPESSRDRDGSE